MGEFPAQNDVNLAPAPSLPQVTIRPLQQTLERHDQSDDTFFLTHHMKPAEPSDVCVVKLKPISERPVLSSASDLPPCFPPCFPPVSPPAAHVGSGHDGVQKEPASLPPGQASHQLHGRQTVSVAGRSTRGSGGGRQGGRPCRGSPSNTSLPPARQEDCHPTEPALESVCLRG